MGWIIDGEGGGSSELEELREEQLFLLFVINQIKCHNFFFGKDQLVEAFFFSNFCLGQLFIMAAIAIDSPTKSPAGSLGRYSGGFYVIGQDKRAGPPIHSIRALAVGIWRRRSYLERPSPVAGDCDCRWSPLRRFIDCCCGAIGVKLWHNGHRSWRFSIRYKLPSNCWSIFGVNLKRRRRERKNTNRRG